MVELEAVFGPEEENEMIQMNEGLITRLNPMPARFLPSGFEDMNCMVHVRAGGQVSVVETREEIIGMIGKGVTIEAHYSDSDPRDEEMYPEHIVFYRPYFPGEGEGIEGANSLIFVHPEDPVPVTEGVGTIQGKINGYYSEG